jgi:hypothetical protein
MEARSSGIVSVCGVIGREDLKIQVRIPLGCKVFRQNIAILLGKIDLGNMHCLFFINVDTYSRLLLYVCT